MKGVIFVGLQASGKSSYYLKNFYGTHIRLSMDMLRTRHREAILLDACVESKQKFVIDTVEDREKYIRKLKAHRFEVIGYYFQSSLDECLRRNSMRKGKECIPEVGLRGIYNKLELPKYSEGFDKLYYVVMTNGGFTVEEWKDEV